ncbi:hypothetical protein XELAEV_18044516mg [Xenopus laevis]|uniref:Uncharacterized protein n=1 Tax=Xenopus laevis TaxID=8355 RepID=A0A974BZJ6_XENLA|nr:hypothetical protein XELAEV_18044516mg [Xenopus laevis]
MSLWTRCFGLKPDKRLIICFFLLHILIFITVLIAALIKYAVDDKSQVNTTAASPASSVPEVNVSSTAHVKVVKRDICTTV